MISILYALNDVFHKGGTEAVVLGYFNNLNKSEFHIDFLLHGNAEENKDNPIHNFLISQGSKIFYVTPRGVSYRKNIKEIRNILKSNHYDIVHSHMDSAGMFFLREAKKAGINVRISHSHNTNDQISKGNALKNFLFKIVLNYARVKLNKYATVRIACSDAAGQWLFGKHEYIVLKNAIDLQKFSYSEKTRDLYRDELGIGEKLVIGHVGRFADQKNHEFLIDIFNEFLKVSDNSVLLLIGDGELREKIQQKVSSYGIENDVKFLGLRDDVQNIMQAIDVFLMPSKYEGLSVVLVEAQTAGLPCLVSDNMAQESFVTSDCLPLGLDKSAKEWAENLLLLSQRPNDRERAVSIVREKGFDIIDIIERLEKIYSQGVLNSNG